MFTLYLSWLSFSHPLGCKETHFTCIAYSLQLVLLCIHQFAKKKLQNTSANHLAQYSLLLMTCVGKFGECFNHMFSAFLWSQQAEQGRGLSNSESEDPFPCTATGLWRAFIVIMLERCPIFKDISRDPSGFPSGTRNFCSDQPDSPYVGWSLGELKARGSLQSCLGLLC